jgi:hypothetical protein
MGVDEQIMKWLIEHDLIKYSTLERRAKMPQGCFYKVENKLISLPPKHIRKLCEILKHYGFVPVIEKKISDERKLTKKLTKKLDNVLDKYKL